MVSFKNPFFYVFCYENFFGVVLLNKIFCLLLVLGFLPSVLAIGADPDGDGFMESAGEVRDALMHYTGSFDEARDELGESCLGVVGLPEGSVVEWREYDDLTYSKNRGRCRYSFNGSSYFLFYAYRYVRGDPDAKSWRVNDFVGGVMYPLLNDLYYYVPPPRDNDWDDDGFMERRSELHWATQHWTGTEQQLIDALNESCNNGVWNDSKYYYAEFVRQVYSDGTVWLKCNTRKIPYGYTSFWRVFKNEDTGLFESWDSSSTYFDGYGSKFPAISSTKSLGSVVVPVIA